MAKPKKTDTTYVDQTEYVSTDDLRNIINEQEKQKKECFFKKLFKKKNKK